MKVAYCLNGHYIGSLEPAGRLSHSWTPVRNRLENPQSPNHVPRFCSECGADNISACQHCQAPIVYERGRPAYCSACGNPYPWQQAAIENLQEILRESELGTEDRKEVEKVLPDVLRDTPKTESAALKMRRILGKLGKPLYEVTRKVVTDIASETAKKTLGLK